MKIADILNVIAECDTALGVAPPTTPDPRQRALYTRHMERQYLRLADAWKMVFTADDYHDMSDDCAALFNRSTVHAEADCLRSANDWAAQAYHWEAAMGAQAPVVTIGDPRRPSPTPR